jgi:hypothetical protein
MSDEFTKSIYRGVLISQKLNWHLKSMPMKEDWILQIIKRVLH